MELTGRDKRRGKSLVLVKALPHVGSKHGETVCCAGVTPDRKWARQFPIHFRRLQQKFKRWDWIEYDWIPPTDDQRPESQRVQEDTISVIGDMRVDERTKFLTPIITRSTLEAAANGQTLTLIRPREVSLSWQKKSVKEMDVERAAYAAASRQGSFFDADLKALSPCPYKFRFKYQTEDGVPHQATCDDWETAATFFREEKRVGEKAALQRIERIFGHEYPSNGMVFAMGTHSQRPEQWLLVGVIRLDENRQSGFLF